MYLYKPITSTFHLGKGYVEIKIEMMNIITNKILFFYVSNTFFGIVVACTYNSKNEQRK